MSTDQIKDKLRRHIAQENVQFCKAPGRINLIGEHTDYNGGLVLPGAIDRYMYFALAPNNTNQINITAIDKAETATIEVGNYNRSKIEWANYFIGNLMILQSQGYHCTGFDGAFYSDIPIGAGLSSSSAMEVGFIKSVSELFGFELSGWDIVHTSHRSNHEFLGIQGGFLDQFSSTFGIKESVLLMDCALKSHQVIKADLEDYTFLLINTEVTHNHLTSGYNDRVRECQQALSSIQQRFPEVSSLSGIRHVNQLTDVRFDDSIIENRATYIIEENQRVRHFVEALAQQDYQRCGELLYRSHNGLSELYEVSCTELDYLVELLYCLLYTSPSPRD